MWASLLLSPIGRRTTGFFSPLRALAARAAGDFLKGAIPGFINPAGEKDWVRADALQVRKKPLAHRP
jgi:hypothetical protein